MNKAKRNLRKFQEKTYLERTLSERFDGFEYRAYPETAEGLDLDSICKALKVKPRQRKNGIEECCDSLRYRILVALETPDPPEEKEVA